MLKGTLFIPAASRVYLSPGSAKVEKSISCRVSPELASLPLKVVSPLLTSSPAAFFSTQGRGSEASDATNAIFSPFTKYPTWLTLTSGGMTSGPGVGVGSGTAATTLGCGMSVLPSSKNSARPNRLGFCHELSDLSAFDQISLISRSWMEAPLICAWKPNSLP